MSEPFSARYPGKCAACGERYPSATSIRRSDDGSYIHADCTEHEPKPLIEGEACPVCWLRHPEGACDRD